MCHRWPRVHPEVKMTTKQLISVHHILNFEPGKDKDPTPELDCQLAEIWKLMEKDVSIWYQRKNPFFFFVTTEVDKKLDHFSVKPGNTKGEIITVPLTSCLTDLESAV
jgi:hypothetical protein